MSENLIGSELRAIREEKRLGSLKQLAEKLGVSNNTLAKYELGTVLPEIEFLMMFSDVSDASFVRLVNLRIQSGKVFSDNLDKQKFFMITEPSHTKPKLGHSNKKDLNGQNVAGTYVIDDLLMKCQEACATTHGKHFEDKPVNTKIAYALELHRRVIDMSLALECSSKEINSLEVENIQSLLNCLLKMNKVRGCINFGDYWKGFANGSGGAFF